jgi:signal-transduction protein with cAMP-binding, CBS, and nucleotidyltransferase domain
LTNEGQFFSRIGERRENLSQTAHVEAANAQLAAHPFLSGLSPHHLEILATAASRKEFPKGEFIFRAAEPANGFYLIENGAVAIEGSVFEQSAPRSLLKSWSLGDSNP